MQMPQCLLATWQVHATYFAASMTVHQASQAPSDRHIHINHLHQTAFRHVLSGLQPGLCLQASLDGLIALTEGCNEAFLQWAFYPANGASAALNHTATGLCMHPAGAPSALWSHAVNVIAYEDTQLPSLGILHHC